MTPRLKGQGVQGHRKVLKFGDACNNVTLWGGGIISVYDPVTVKFGVRVQGCENKYDNVPVRNDFLKYAEQLRLFECTV